MLFRHGDSRARLFYFYHLQPSPASSACPTFLACTFRFSLPSSDIASGVHCGSRPAAAPLPRARCCLLSRIICGQWLRCHVCDLLHRQKVPMDCSEQFQWFGAAQTGPANSTNQTQCWVFTAKGQSQEHVTGAKERETKISGQQAE